MCHPLRGTLHFVNGGNTRPNGRESSEASPPLSIRGERGEEKLAPPVMLAGAEGILDLPVQLRERKGE